MPGPLVKKSNYVYSTRNDKMLVQPKYLSFNHGIYPFGYEEISLGDFLKPHFKEVNSVHDFKVALRTSQG